jgi:hypothetical protein
MAKYFFLLSALFLLTGFGSALASDSYRLPDEWHELAEDRPKSLFSARAFSNSNGIPTEEVAAVVQRIFRLNASSIEEASLISDPLEFNLQSARPKGWVPWHLEYFTTDLGISASGSIGVITIKGTPAVQAFWRRKLSSKFQAEQVSQPKELSTVDANEPTSIQLDAGTSPQEMTKELEPAIRATIATGKVQDEERLRDELSRAALEFQRFVRVLEMSSDSDWWVSAFRVDFIVDLSGRVSLGTFGGETRIRFDWKRLKRPKRSSSIGVLASSHLEQSLQKFVQSVSEDVEEAASEIPKSSPFQAYQFRVGLGINGKGDVGFAKGSGSVLGHIYFSRDVKKPSVSSSSLPESTMPSLQEYPLLEMSPSESHIEYAKATGLKFELSESGNRRHPVAATFRVPRAALKKGLKKAMRIGLFFAKQAELSSSQQMHPSKWKIYELRTDFDMSIGGDLGLVSANGLFSTEICFYNQNF